MVMKLVRAKMSLNNKIISIDDREKKNSDVV